jgi:hypothetical protein
MVQCLHVRCWLLIFASKAHTFVQCLELCCMVHVRQGSTRLLLLNTNSFARFGFFAFMWPAL